MNFWIELNYTFESKWIFDLNLIINLNRNEFLNWFESSQWGISILDFVNQEINQVIFSYRQPRKYILVFFLNISRYEKLRNKNLEISGKNHPQKKPRLFKLEISGKFLSGKFPEKIIWKKTRRFLVFQI